MPPSRAHRSPMSNMLTHTKPVILSLPLPSCLCRVAQAEFWTKELKRGAGMWQ